MAKAKRGCGTCQLAAFERSPTGKPLRKVAGRCRFEPVITASSAQRVHVHRVGIWPNDGEECPTYKPTSEVTNG